MKNKENNAIDNADFEKELSKNTEFGNQDLALEDAIDDNVNSSNENNGSEVNIDKSMQLIDDEIDEDDEDEFALEDEFSNIPDSYFDEEIAFDEEDEANSISALLYDDDDDTASDDNFEEPISISFSELKQQIQKIKDDARDHRLEEATNELKNEESNNKIENNEADEDSAKDIVAEDQVPDNADELFPDTDDEAIEDTEEEDSATNDAKKSYIRNKKRNDEIPEDIEEAAVKEHIITIDRSRVKDKSTPTDRFIDWAFEVVEILVFALLTLLMLTTFVFRQTTVSGSSMEPTFSDGDKLIISDLFYTPERGDIIVFDDRSKTGTITVNGKEINGYDEKPAIKRVIGIEGDTVKIEDNLVQCKYAGTDEYVILDLPLAEIPTEKMDPITVGAGELFVLGDNVNLSKDSTEVGTIRVESVLGKVILRYKSDGKFVFDTKFN